MTRTRQRWKVAGLFFSLMLTGLAVGRAARPGEITPENQTLPCIEYLFRCDSWCMQQNCGCTPPAGYRLCPDEGPQPYCNCDSSGDTRTCIFCPK